MGDLVSKLIDINRKSYMQSPNAPLDLTLSNPEGSKFKINQILKVYISPRSRFSSCITYSPTGNHDEPDVRPVY